MPETLIDLIEARPWLQTLLGVLAVAGVAVLANFFVKRIILNALRRIFRNTSLAAGAGAVDPVVSRLANIVPANVIYAGVTLIPHLPDGVVTVTRNVASAFIVLTVVLAIGAALNLVNDIYQRRPGAASRPIKGYLQLLKIVLYVAGVILVVAALIERSPLLLLSGLGAMAAVLMLVFKDTILSLVASVQLTSNDMVRLGDWIEMPQLNADGDVIDIALHTVKVQNWDKTITTIPTYRLINESFKNWRGMSESGGRRIKRPLLLDQNSVRFLSDDERDRLRRFALIDGYLNEKREELEDWNGELIKAGRDPVNTRRVTNVGTFRAYVLAYLKAHPRISKTMTLLVRQLEPTARGLPLEIYCFTTTTAWSEYEDVQGDIFDHLIAILPEFGLRLFQEPSGLDMRGALSALAQGKAEDMKKAPAEGGGGSS